MSDEDTIEDEKLLILPLNDKNSKKISQVISNDTARAILEALTDESMSTSDIAEKLGIPLTTVQYNIEKLMDSGLVKVEKTKWSEKFREVKIYAPQKKMVVILPEKTSREDVISALKKYLPMVGIAAVFSGMLEFMTSLSMTASRDGAIEAVEKSLYTTETVVPQTNNETQAVPPALETMLGTGINDTDAASYAENATEGVTVIEEIGNATIDRFASEAVNITPTSDAITEEAAEMGFQGLQIDLASHIGFWFFLGAVTIIVIMFLLDRYRNRRGK